MDHAKQHDAAVEAIASGLRSLFAPGGEWSVVSGARWQPLADFPNYVYTFDVMVLEAGGRLDWDAARNCLGPEVRPVTIIDIVRHDDWETEFYDKPDVLSQAGVYEYCLWDPTAERLRPPLQAVRLWESAYRPLRTSPHGVFFSTAGFCLDVRGPTVELSRCGRCGDEEELFTCRRLLAAAVGRADRGREEVAGLTAKIARLAAKLGGAAP